MILSVAASKVIKESLGWLVRSFDEYVIADEETPVVNDSGNVTGISGTVELCVMVQVDLGLDGAAAFDGNCAASQSGQFFVRSVNEQTKIVCSRRSLFLQRDGDCRTWFSRG